MKKILAFVLCLALLLCILPACSSEAPVAPDEHIVILYENDVHCEVAGYSKLAMLKSELKASIPYVGVVSVGDYVQGGSLGSISRGEYIVNLMNLVGYDAVMLGNHEFDYRLPCTAYRLVLHQHRRLLRVQKQKRCRRIVYQPA